MAEEKEGERVNLRMVDRDKVRNDGRKEERKEGRKK